MYGLRTLEQDLKCDCQEANLKKFLLDAFASKEAQMGWQPLFTVQVQGVPRHIPSEWGSLTVENVSQEMTQVHATDTRAHQDSCMSGICLWDSITSDARSKVTTYADQYKINGRDSGPALLRAIIACTHIDTRAASERALRDLENLAPVMVRLDSNNELFNLYVENKYCELRARAITNMTVISHLFAGYEAAAHETFVAWMKCHHDRVDDTEVVYTMTQLMHMALRKYAYLKMTGTWARPNVDQEKLIALASDVSKINKTLKKPAAKGAQTPAAATPKPHHPTCPEDEWKFVEPAPGAS